MAMRAIRPAAQALVCKNATIGIVAHCENIQETPEAQAQNKENQIKSVNHTLENFLLERTLRFAGQISRREPGPARRINAIIIDLRIIRSPDKRVEL